MEEQKHSDVRPEKGFPARVSTREQALATNAEPQREPVVQSETAAQPCLQGWVKPSQSILLGFAFLPECPRRQVTTALTLSPQLPDSGKALIPHFGFKTYHCVQLIVPSVFQPSLHPPDLIQSRRKTTASPDDQMVTRVGGQDPHYPVHLQPTPREV